MFKKILIANRGEIACRVAATARRMGVRTVAVYSDADAHAKHVRACDEAVHIGGSAPRESYLRWRAHHRGRAGDRRAGHPSRLRLPVARTRTSRRPAPTPGLVFIGPPAVGHPGDGPEGRAAKPLMEKAGVPLVPGYHGDDKDPALLQREADRIGYPVLIKASAGGGGKGMRARRQGRGLRRRAGVVPARGASSFGDDAVLVESYVTRPRHIEIQVFGDTHGNCVYLFERDCSVQRRHQKVLEEAPAPGMSRARAPRWARRRWRRRRRWATSAPARWSSSSSRPRRRRPALLLHGDEHAAAGGAPGDRGDHRPRPGRVAAARGRRRAAAAEAGGAARSTATRSRRASAPRTPTTTSCPPPARCTVLPH